MRERELVDGADELLDKLVAVELPWKLMDTGQKNETLHVYEREREKG